MTVPTRKKVRPALWHIDFWGICSEKFAGKWSWVDLEELVEVAGPFHGIPGDERQDLLFEFSDFRFRGSKYRGVCIAAPDPSGCHPFLFAKMGFDPRRPDVELFFWRRADLAYGDDGPNSPYRNNNLGKICSYRALMVPSGWANGVLDEIERRRKAGEPILQACQE